MATRRVVKAIQFEPKADLDHHVVQLRFVDQETADVTDIWLVESAIVAVHAEIGRMLQENPEILAWKPNPLAH